MSDYLPDEVLLEIFVKLPVKSLLRCRCVSKFWFSILTRSDFRAKYLKESKSHLLLKYYCLETNKERYSLRFDEDGEEATLDELFELKCPFRTQTNTFFRMVGIVNGLICLSDDQFTFAETVIVWNPAIRRSVTLPKPVVCHFVHNYGPYMFALGFGVDSTTNFKIVRITYLHHKGENNPGVFSSKDGYIAPPVVEIFAQGTGSWKTFEGYVPSYKMVEYFWSSAFVNGKIHWLVYGDCNMIMGFEVGDEIFSILNLPDALASVNPLDMVIGVFGDALSVFQYDNRTRIQTCSVWVKQDSWTNLFNIDLQGIILGAALGFRRNGEILLVESNGRVVSYDHANTAVKNLQIFGGRDSVYMGTYSESLALLDGVNANVDSYDMVDFEDESVSNGPNAPDAEALQRLSLMHINVSSAYIDASYFKKD